MIKATIWSTGFRGGVRSLATSLYKLSNFYLDIVFVYNYEFYNKFRTHKIQILVPGLHEWYERVRINVLQNQSDLLGSTSYLRICVNLSNIFMKLLGN